MDDLLGLLIFAAIAVVGVVSKVVEGRKAEQRKNRPIVKRDDLPEATKRMLYGDGAGPRTATPRQDAPHIPTAKPRGAVTQTVPPPTPQPRQTAPQRRPVPQSAGQRQQAPQAQRETPARRMATSASKTASQVPQTLREARRQTHRSLQQAWNAAQRKQPPPTPPQQQQEEEQPLRHAKQQARPQNRQEAVAQTKARARKNIAAAPKRKKTSIQALFTNSHNVRLGVIMREILGPPKGML
jgi:hypothetical protein